MPNKIAQHLHLLQGKKVTIGFDGFIDSIVRVVLNRSQTNVKYFGTIREFGQYTVERSGGNFSVELQQVVKKAGGNMPIMARAMSGWNLHINCVGTLGLPEIHPLFLEFPENCRLLSFGEPGITTALEFNDGKIIMGEMSSLDSADWNTICRIIGIEKLRGFLHDSSLIGIVNWSELIHATSIWQGLLDEVLPFIHFREKPVAFFDLSDCSKRSVDDIKTALDTLRKFNPYCRVALGLNRNEAQLLHGMLGGASPGNDLVETGNVINDWLKTDVLVIHHQHVALAWHQGEVFSETCELITNPVISTGAGDNFNAGFAVAMLMNLDIPACLALAHRFAGHYMRTGRSLTAKEILQPTT